MVKQGLLVLFGLFVPGLAEQPRLRGLASEPESNAGAANSGVFAACSCQHGSEPCACSFTRLGADASAKAEAEPANLTKSVQNQTEALMAWWKAQGEQLQGLECSCMQGGSCQCSHAEGEGKELGEAKSADAAATLKNETESALSLWWAAGGGFHRYHPYHPYYHPYHPYYGGGCGGGHYGGCGCGWVGCHCAHGGYHGCHWR